MWLCTSANQWPLQFTSIQAPQFHGRHPRLVFTVSLTFDICDIKRDYLNIYFITHMYEIWSKLACEFFIAKNMTLTFFHPWVIVARFEIKKKKERMIK